jgi:hypothetical protein
MDVLIYFTAYYWDNYQGGSGKYIEHKIRHTLTKYEDTEAFPTIFNDSVREYLKRTRPFDQSVYLKQQGEYVITKVEFIW